MFNSIPHSRLLLYALLLGLLPIILACGYFFAKRADVISIGNDVQSLREMALIREKKQALNMAVKENYRSNDHFYIDKNIESLTLMETEIEALQKILRQSHYVENETLKKRLEFLTTNNSLVFSEGVVQAYPYFRETVETLVHPVEIDASDLEKILSKIEGIPIGSYTPGPNPPQLLITEFKLDRKQTPEKNEVFTLSLKLIKREYFD